MTAVAPTSPSSPASAPAEFKLAGYNQPLAAIAGWIAALRSIPENVTQVEYRGNPVQVLCRVNDGCYVLLRADNFDDVEWVVPAVVADADGPSADCWSFVCESFGDVLVTYFYCL